MTLQTQLTVGWQDDPQAPHAAARLDEAALQKGNGYTEALAETLRSICRAGDNCTIAGLDRLLRRRTHGFEPIKRFVTALASLSAAEFSPATLVCQIDAFAYGFLKGTKNFDFLLPINPAINADFYSTQRHWLTTFAALEAFERSGKPLPAKAGVSSEQYLAFREIIARPSARDERRALATLLVSGPSTLDDISTDLGLNYTLGQRALTVFEAIGVIEIRHGGSYAIAMPHLALTLFGLRETMGLDLLSVLPKEA